MNHTLTDLLLRDPQHPEVRKLLLEHYRRVCAEQQMLARVLGVKAPSVAPMPYEPRTQAKS